MRAHPAPASAGDFPETGTFSIIAYDTATGEWGGAVQSRVFAVGNGVLSAEAGVGVVATQAVVDVSYGPQALALLRQGKSAAEVVKYVWEHDSDPDTLRWAKTGRQFAVVDARGSVAAYTGPTAPTAAGDKQAPYVSAQGNTLADKAVPDSMVTAFQRTKGHLALRLLAGIEAGQAAGGDRRGKQSAAMLIVKKCGGVWLHNDVVLRLQVDDSPEPIVELRRLVEKAPLPPRTVTNAQSDPACRARPSSAEEAKPSDYLYLWTASADSLQPDFLAVLDVRESAGRYGRLVTTVPVPGRHNGPHHTEHAMPADGLLFANGFASGQSFIFDMRTPGQPRLAGEFADKAGMMHPHSFLRLPNGNVLATFQMQHDEQGIAPGGLAELTSRGDLVRSVSANRPGVDRRIRPYSAAIVPSLDRVVTTTTDMDGDEKVRAVQLWRLSDLSLLSTFDLPNGPRGDEGELTAEARLLDDGKTVLVSTFSCGLYLLRGIEGTAPSARLVASFPEKKGTSCAIPVIAGHYYLVTVPAWSAVVSLDIADPAHPREVSRVTFGANDVPHWISLEPNQRRVVITGYAGMKSRVMIARFDPATGHLQLDERFREDGAAEAGFLMKSRVWPHGGDAAGIPHGAVFSRP